MSTRRSIKHREPADDSPGYHLFDDCTDFEPEPPVYLRLDCVQVDLETCDEGVSLTVKLPRAMARELGLLPPSA